MTPIREDLLTVYSPGDSSVGLFSATWKITGPMIFESESDREEFRESIRQAFGLLSENHDVIFGSEPWPGDPPEVEKSP